MDSEEVKKLQSDRLRYLEKAYHVSKGDPSAFVPWKEIGNELGFDSNYSISLMEWLGNENYIHNHTVSSFSLTNSGIRIVENSIAKPDEIPATGFASYNIINVSNMNNSQIQQGTNNSNQTQTIKTNESNELSDTLTTDLENTCRDLKLFQKNYKKFHKNAIIITIIGIAIFGIGLHFSNEETIIPDISFITLPSAIVLLILLIFAGIEERKAEKERRKTLGYNKLTLYSLEALKFLEEYEREPDFDHLKNSESKLKEISENLRINWSNIYKTNTSFRSLELPIEEFKKYLSENFIPSYLEVDQEILKTDKTELENRKKTIIHLLQLFQSNNFQLIDTISKELKEYVPQDKPPEKTAWQKFLENRIRMKIIISVFGSALIIAVSLVISHFLSQIPPATNIDFINWSIMMILGGLGIFNPILFLVKK